MLISENMEGFQILHFHAFKNVEDGTVQLPEAAPSLNPLLYTVQTDSPNGQCTRG